MQRELQRSDVADELGAMHRVQLELAHQLEEAQRMQYVAQSTVRVLRAELVQQQAQKGSGRARHAAGYLALGWLAGAATVLIWAFIG